MTEGLEAVTTNMLGLALDAAVMRQQAIAANIANSNTEGYIPVRVNFEEQLEQIRTQLRGGERVGDMNVLDGITPLLEKDERVANAVGGMALDDQIVQLSQNAIQYQVLVKGLSKQYAILAAAVSDGNK